MHFCDLIYASFTLLQYVTDVALLYTYFFTPPCIYINYISIKLIILIKFHMDSNILASPEAGWGNCSPYVLAPPSLSCESGG